MDDNVICEEYEKEVFCVKEKIYLINKTVRVLKGLIYIKK